MSAPVTNQEIGCALCEVFGLDSSTVGKITIAPISADGIATVNIERAIQRDEMDKLKVVFDKYELVIKGSAAAEVPAEPGGIVSDAAMDGGVVKHHRA